MKRRHFLALLATAPVAVVASSCGSGTNVSTDGTTTTPPTTVAPTTTPAIVHPTGADDVVIRLMVDGGFVAPGFLFTRLPRVVITGDGSVYFQGAQIEIYPQPLLPPVLVGKITDGEIQALLAGAQAGGLFRNITYGQPPNGIADAPNTILDIYANGAHYTHNAYALGMAGEETDKDRHNFSEYADLLDPIANGVPNSTPYAAPRFAIRATPADPNQPTDGVKPNVVDWPSAAGVKLADAGECKVVQATAVGTLLAQATQITQFVDAGVKYVLLVRPMLPGDPGC